MLSEKRKITDIVKFIAALLVVIGHLFLYYSGMQAVTQWVNLGAQCVSLFLFFSAYGLMCAYERNGKAYLNGFFSRRLGRILIPLVTAYAVSLVVYAVFKGKIDWHNVLVTLSWGGPYLKFSWYVTEITALYLLFYVCAKISGSENRLAWSLSISAFLLIIVLFITRQPVWYINGLPCFVLGIWYQRYEERILTALDKYKWLVLFALLVGFLLTFQWHYIRDAVPALSAWRYEYIAMYLSNFLFVLIVINILEFIPNKTIEFSLGGGYIISSFYEVYLLQNAVMIVFSSFSLPFAAMWILTMCSTVFIAVVFNLLNKKISNLFVR